MSWSSEASTVANLEVIFNGQTSEATWWNKSTIRSMKQIPWLLTRAHWSMFTLRNRTKSFSSKQVECLKDLKICSWCFGKCVSLLSFQTFHLSLFRPLKEKHLRTVDVAPIVANFFITHRWCLPMKVATRGRFVMLGFGWVVFCAL